MTDIEMLPLPKPEPQVSVAGAHEAMLADALEDYFDTEAVQSYARAVAEHNVRLRGGIDPLAVLIRAQEAEARAERLAEALRYAVDNPEFDSQVFDTMARAALRDHDQECGNP